MEEKTISKNHKLNVINRKYVLITGVTDVITFDLNQVLLETEDGMLDIKGKDLHVTKLTVEKGEIEIDGRLDSFVYTDIKSHTKETENFLKKLFK